MFIIPAIDILGGQCVRLTKGDYATAKIYRSDPVAVAREFEKQGADRLHLVDLDGAKAGKPLNAETILAIRRATVIPIQVGGGIRTLKTAERYLSGGIDRVILGTKAITDFNFLKNSLKKFGSDRVSIALDLKNNTLVTEGWLEKSEMNYLNFARYCRAMINHGSTIEIICTDISRDGTLSEPNYEPLERLKALGLRVIASGGISTLKTLKKLSDLKMDGAILGKALYEKKLTIAQALDAVRLPSGLARRLIPCLDIAGGRVVKGVGFKNLRDAGDPVELARYYSDQGADELVFLDITATIEQRTMLNVLVSRIAREINIPFCVGGGIQTLGDIRTLLQAGADKISIGSAAIKNPTLIRQTAECFGSQCIVISLDVKRVGDRWRLTIRGGRTLTDVDAVEFAQQMEQQGAGELLVNSLDRDGTQQGYDLPLLRAITSRVRIPVVASSGAGSPKDVLDAFTLAHCDAALLASLLHNGALTISELKNDLIKNKIPIRN